MIGPASVIGSGTLISASSSGESTDAGPPRQHRQQPGPDREQRREPAEPRGQIGRAGEPQDEQRRQVRGGSGRDDEGVIC